MSIDKEIVRKVAGLARLSLSESDLERFTPQVAGIVKWVEMLGEVNTENVAPLANVVNVDLKLRPDIISDGGYQDKILANAPESMEGFFVVPKVVE
ncbi:MAG: Asp-tRNA(Asn)/Glu-tRNA(Gln) amidotransferase subunit GatC [Micavibrio aeruginosavorus]|uniref:Aspartyl/glutamyl-tRNA(Asn/Gln) amidotransferase subunit C n=1 Tax=Micavibrio aeruginosavorus TaxID=349221 RepID=A0A7T5R107_9BACT|nr:MAG: Asp-tRNA(Asn)/Glu-tRNA(Gln) amidotransferase subunit GatC [Micavibrio aeruginosavorus]